MGATTGIEWTDATVNFWVGCTKVSPGCDHCYAETLEKRWGRNFITLRKVKGAVPLAYQLQRRAEKEGRRLRVFTCSMSDFFHQHAAPWREEAWRVMGECSLLDWQVLTKRPGLAVAWHRSHGWLPNVWLGASAESAKYLPRLDVLASVPAPVRFVSAEPLLGPVDLWPWIHEDRWGETEKPINWVIVGGESGPKARPFDLAWARDIVAQCKVAGVPVFVKQLGSNPVARNDGERGGDLWPGGTVPWDESQPWGYQGELHPIRLRDRKGSDQSEWPSDLCVREMPEARR